MTKRSAVVASAVAVAVVGAGAAWAAWSLSGDTQVTAAAGTAVQLTVTGTNATALVPGSKSDVTVNVVNSNKFPVLIKSINFSDFASNKTGCDGSNIQQVTTVTVPAGTTVAAENSKSVVLAQSLKMIADPADECQGASFTFKATVGAESAAS
ncbi:hypothetical protein [Actinoplanes sp. HUAS TT8]|uniref:hypothetical protein n=1 Tax=Actinoplanes sp. HUAS TT8 TaxID=3447453 RepID=UPI003F51E513